MNIFFPPYTELYEQHSAKELQLFIKGMNSYYNHSYERKLDEPEVIWQGGSSTLLDYKKFAPAIQKNAIILFLPSLINKAYILDLHHKRSLIRWLAGYGLHIMMIDWGEPGEQEAQFGCEDYLWQRLQPAIEFLGSKYKKPIILVGYCFGGLIAMAAAQHNKRVKKLVLLATPWDFSKISSLQVTQQEYWQKPMNRLAAKDSVISGGLIQHLFNLTYSEKIYQKYIDFAQVDQDSNEAEIFVATERWVHDNVPVTSELMHDFIHLFLNNDATINNKWQLHPEKIKIPTMLVSPKKDQLVPPASILPLAKILPNNILMKPNSGHVGMIIGSRARRSLWPRLKRFILQD